MRKIVGSGDYRIEILEKGDQILTFRDLASTLTFLRQFKDDSRQMALLREMVLSHCSTTSSLEVEEVLSRLAPLLVSGRIKVLKTHEMPQSAVSQEAEQQAAPAAPPGDKMAPAKRGWIEIRLHDCEGNPVPGKKFRITMADGSVEEGVLDDFGHAEYNDIAIGTCMVAFPEFDAESWEHE